MHISTKRRVHGIKAKLHTYTWKIGLDSILVSNKGGRVITENDRWFLIPAHKIFSIFKKKKGSCDFHGIFGKALKYAFGQVSTRSVN